MSTHSRFQLETIHFDTDQPTFSKRMKIARLWVEAFGFGALLDCPPTMVIPVQTILTKSHGFPVRQFRCQSSFVSPEVSEDGSVPDRPVGTAMGG